MSIPNFGDGDDDEGYVSTEFVVLATEYTYAESKEEEKLLRRSLRQLLHRRRLPRKRALLIPHLQVRMDRQLLIMLASSLVTHMYMVDPA